MKKLILVLVVLTSLVIPSIVYSDGSLNIGTNSLGQLTGDKQAKEDASTLIERNNIITEKVNLGVNNGPEGFLSKLFWSIIGGFIGAFIALWLKRFEKPVLLIEATEEANHEQVYLQNRVVPGRWKFFRVKVTNKPLPKFLSWLILRETAESIHAQVMFKDLGRTMKGRWAGTLELPFASSSDILRLANYPEPETIFVGKSTILDIFAKFEQDHEAYGWNNEAYLNNWRTPHYRLDPGDYEIEVVLIGINSEKRRSFRAHIGSTIEDTYIREANK